MKISRLRLDFAKYYTQNGRMQVYARKSFVQDAWQTPRNARTLAAYMALQNQEIGARIAALREARGNPPQEIVAQRLGVSNRSYQAWEAGETKPSWRNLEKLAEYYGVTVEFILTGNDAPAPAEEPDVATLLLQKMESLQERIEANTERLGIIEGRLKEQKKLDQAIRRLIRVTEEDRNRRGRDIGKRDLEGRDDEDHRGEPEEDAA